MDTVRIGIIGAGNMGSNHVKMIGAGEVPGLTLAAVADRKPERLEAALKNSGLQLSTYASGSDLIKDGKVDAVIIATPHYQHPTLTIEALNAGLHVLCEKPAGVYTKQVREANAVAAASDKTYAIMFNQRTNCIYRKMHEIIASGEMGKIRRVNWLITNWYRSQSYYDSGAWRATWAGEGGGVLLNQCPHNLDLWQWLCGLPTTIRAFLQEGKWHDIEVEDDVTAYADYKQGPDAPYISEKGATGVFITSTGDTPGDNRLEILMDGGKLIAENDKLMRWDLKTWEPEFTATYKGGFGEPEYDVYEVETDGYNPQHKGVLIKFAEHILHGEPLVAPGIEGIRGLMISNAMHLSSWLGKPVNLPVDEDLYYEELMKRAATSRHKEETGIIFNTDGSYNAGAKK